MNSEKTPLSKDELRMNLRSKIQASSIRRLNKTAKETKLNELQNQIKQNFGQDIDLNKIMQQMNVSGK